MSWLPILLIVWISVDVLIVAAVAHFARRTATETGTPAALRPLPGRPLSRPVGRRPTRRADGRG